ncbi:uncharacterized protein K452DRAFT_290228 [Aplosporella prunicola CBS 121167]|uniref:Phosphatidylinositol-specific phospholipase C X domain-containing protein n=1 Tax=Aplosporella prunicola CBS 121167 TaxID=1176127 RepID=A0A6A6B519_9PEZI|nr:uncharacterized protein K452DRAFT_290228 [Aplosporella prunicola CBS 121167]KAF2139130.1 hypothetical protein K452DRAFT_290228 [Aplosporella prunicola CBS 121167]
MIFKPLARAAGLATFLLSATSTAQSTTTACNNSPSLCSRSYGNITHLGAHDSAFVRDSSTSFSTSGNQFYNSTTQLDAGVRLLSAQVHQVTGDSGASEWHLCHSSCNLLDMGKLSEWLADIKTWLDANANDVVTLVLVNSDDATAAQLKAEFDDAAIADYAYTPKSASTAPTSWPTLQSLIDAKTRLVTFVASLDADEAASANATYLMDEFNFLYENSYDNTSPANFSCTPDRPTALKGDAAAAAKSNQLFLMNHFLYSAGSFGIETPDTARLEQTNAVSGDGSVGASAATCAVTYGKAPWGVLVDFFNVANSSDTTAIKAVDALNGVTDATGRKDLPVTQLSADSSSSGSSSGDGSSAAAPRLGSAGLVLGVAGAVGALLTMV